jgi:hypothetical protein
MFEEQQSNGPNTGKVTGIDIIRKQLCLVIFYPLSKEANMLSLKSLFAFAVLVPLLGAAIPAEGAKATKSNSTAARVGKPMKLWLLRALVLISAIRTPWDRMPIAGAASKQALDPKAEQSIPPLKIMEGAARD